MQDALTVAIPSFQTAPLLRVVLGAVLRWAPPGTEVVVVDTGSRDGSRELVAAVPGVRLLALDGVPPGPLAHGAALDAALEQASRPLLLALDSDAVPLGPEFFEVLGQLLVRERAAAAGTTKDASTLGWVHRCVRWVLRRRPGPEYRWLRPNRALYRVEVLRRLGLRFTPGAGGRVGEELVQGLLAHGERVALLPPERMQALCVHLRHATMALNPELFPAASRREMRRARRRTGRFLRGSLAQELAAELERRRQL